MDFEVAVWEMTHLMIAPKKVFRNVYYRVCKIWDSRVMMYRIGNRRTSTGKHDLQQDLLTYHLFALQKQTKNTYSSHDPAFPYLLLFFLFLTSLAWSFAYADPSFSNIVRIALTFTTLHCLLSSVTIATFMYFFVDRALGPGGWLTGRPGTGRRRGLFSNVGPQGESELEFGFCFDVSLGIQVSEGNQEY